MRRSALETLLRLNKEAEAEKAEQERRDASRARRAAAKEQRRAQANELVTCAFCRKEVPRRLTVETEIGPGCKTHQGVA